MSSPAAVQAVQGRVSVSPPESGIDAAAGLASVTPEVVSTVSLISGSIFVSSSDLGSVGGVGSIAGSASTLSFDSNQGLEIQFQEVEIPHIYYVKNGNVFHLEEALQKRYNKAHFDVKNLIISNGLAKAEDKIRLNALDRSFVIVNEDGEQQGERIYLLDRFGQTAAKNTDAYHFYKTLETLRNIIFYEIEWHGKSDGRQIPDKLLDYGSKGVVIGNSTRAKSSVNDLEGRAKVNLPREEYGQFQSKYLSELLKQCEVVPEIKKEMSAEEKKAAETKAKQQSLEKRKGLLLRAAKAEHTLRTFKEKVVDFKNKIAEKQKKEPGDEKHKRALPQLNKAEEQLNAIDPFAIWFASCADLTSKTFDAKKEAEQLRKMLDELLARDVQAEMPNRLKFWAKPPVDRTRENLNYAHDVSRLVLGRREDREAYDRATPSDTVRANKVRLDGATESYFKDPITFIESFKDLDESVINQLKKYYTQSVEATNAFSENATAYLANITDEKMKPEELSKGFFGKEGPWISTLSTSAQQTKAVQSTQTKVQNQAAFIQNQS